MPNLGVWFLFARATSSRLASLLGASLFYYGESDNDKGRVPLDYLSVCLTASLSAGAAANAAEVAALLQLLLHYYNNG
jgi:hypothetical protein